MNWKLYNRNTAMGNLDLRLSALQNQKLNAFVDNPGMSEGLKIWGRE